ncbi:hypothetical protein PC129_g9485 [Phytophthora cactorum]|uniref:Uncharacterized protein n=1 Tax=Phytophthora cactorum TaxID=29920 RepID=A0A329S5H0_9STRA|nr:hypothetical protein Pcac1_g15267 [Phytophthora cactorum]KAG2796597.1 hypothetical protein PC111_g21660 [Phytophthora cactorum]KAG2797420.1 hypothetical protein PC112_g21787 [Phytophthora cactorum]KAG2824885.1 hypothetical protein PC113_g21977 [Phytophthora cactorum]KAG2882576.1 hypothetical protein PC115_g21908 [Phytophthora cactorum]
MDKSFEQVDVEQLLAARKQQPVLETSTGPCQDVQRLDTRRRVR